MLKNGMVAALLAVALAGGVRADEYEEETIVSSIVVQAVLPGPAWWRVSDADSTVHILVAPEFTPSDFSWNATILDGRMERARQLIMPAEVEVSLMQIPGLIRTYTGEVLDKQPLETILSEPLRSRFIAARNASGLGSSLSKVRPAYAAERLERELRKKVGMTRGRVFDNIKAAARRHGVRTVRPETTFKPERVRWNAMDAAAGLDRERACLALTLRTMQPILDAQKQAAVRWADGDVRGLLALPKLSHRPPCDNDILSRVDRTHRPELLGAQIDSIEAALKTLGETIAVVRPGLLLSEDGVLMTLQGRGYAIRTPANITEP